MNINSISPDEHKFFQRLENIAKKPDKLQYIGNLPDAGDMVVAIVGTRRPTSYGRTVTSQIAIALARKGVWTISGMALGVDAIVHSETMGAGGKTIAVLSSGLDNPYPATNKELARRILLQGGALISEYELGHRPRLYDFLFRNRLVSGLADALIVTEANIRSGTLSTVTRALEQGKPVYVVPGPITSPLSAGCNALIAQGASPIVSVDGLLEQLGIASTQKIAHGDNDEETAVIKLLQGGMNDGDDIQIATGFPVTIVSQTLTMLEIKGVVTALGGNKWRL
ncbi:MAG: DNA-processing protein DprA [Candidatus Saccharimonadales bacterium]